MEHSSGKNASWSLEKPYPRQWKVSSASHIERQEEIFCFVPFISLNNLGPFQRVLLTAILSGSLESRITPAQYLTKFVVLASW